MSGGTFNYKQYVIDEIADEIDVLIRFQGKTESGSYGIYTFEEFEPRVEEKLKEAVGILRKAAIYAQRVDWYLSGDDGDESFLRRLEEDLTKLERDEPDRQTTQ